MLNAQDVVKQMSIDMGVLPGNLHEIIRTAPLRYKVFRIPKKSGGDREVAQPARELKNIQRWIVQNITPLLPVHQSVTAYKAGSSIKSNAEVHVGNNFLLKIDFQNFFPSIIRDDIVLHLRKHCSGQYDDSAVALIAYCLCWAPGRIPPLRLCIGAPSSPLISNSILHSLDSAIFDTAAACGAKYTRYADDLSISSSRRGDLDEMYSFIKTAVERLEYPRLKINSSKTVFASRKCKKIVTGLVLTPDKKISVGRERKKVIRAMYHRFRCGLLDPKEQEKLSGLIAFVESVEPGFKGRLERSYEAKLKGG